MVGRPASRWATRSRSAPRPTRSTDYGLFITIALTYTGGLQGIGDTKSPRCISVTSQIVVPLGICFVVHTSRLEPIDIWLAILAGHITRCVLTVVRFNQGKWRAIAVDIGGRR